MTATPSASFFLTRDRLPTPLTEVDALTILGVRIWNLTRDDVARLFTAWAREPDKPARAVYIANAHTLTLASDDPSYCAVLNQGDAVFGDGSGVRWAARMRGVRMKDNLVGTDLLPHLFASSEGGSLRYFLLGGEKGAAAQATVQLHSMHPSLSVVGFHHGYFEPAETAAVIDFINETAPDVLLVAMGNPLQERWIHDHRDALRVRICVGVGGLFDHWSGRLRRAPRWARDLGIEWMQILLQQPCKWRRYVLGGSMFVARALRSAERERRIPCGT
jgi:N-acetylglucosaminyldiphosphoundecaprenol N-acetyl-beta-D-mannosaminyltransferase